MCREERAEEVAKEAPPEGGLQAEGQVRNQPPRISCSAVRCPKQVLTAKQGATAPDTDMCRELGFTDKQLIPFRALTCRLVSGLTDEQLNTVSGSILYRSLTSPTTAEARAGL